MPDDGFELKQDTINQFSQSNPMGKGQGDVPALLRRVADTIEGLGPVEVQDVVFHVELTALDEENYPSLTVYFYPEKKSED